MKKVVVASENPAKINAVTGGFGKIFPDEDFIFQPVNVNSGVSEQPFSDQETFQGALNRALRAKDLVQEADYWVGIEGGTDYFGRDLSAFAWMVITDGNRMGKGKTGAFILPPAITDLIHQGMELGEADDVFFNRINSKRENGAIGILSGDIITRMQLYEQAVIMALIPFKHPELYPDNDGISQTEAHPSSSGA